MTAHLIADVTTPVTTPDPATTAPGWLTLSAALTDEVRRALERGQVAATTPVASRTATTSPASTR